MPIALGLGAGSISRRPLGYGIVGGVLFSTVLTLYLVPVAWVLFERLREREGADLEVLCRLLPPSIAEPVALSGPPRRRPDH